MNRIWVIAAAFGAMAALNGCVVEERHHPSGEVVAQPVVVEEGAVAPMEVDEYYVMGGRYYYWHPDAHKYVALHGAPPHGHKEIAVEHLPERR